MKVTTNRFLVRGNKGLAWPTFEILAQTGKPQRNNSIWTREKVQNGIDCSSLAHGFTKDEVDSKKRNKAAAVFATYIPVCEHI